MGGEQFQGKNLWEFENFLLYLSPCWKAEPRLEGGTLREGRSVKFAFSLYSMDNAYSLSLNIIRNGGEILKRGPILYEKFYVIYNTLRKTCTILILYLERGVRVECMQTLPLPNGGREVVFKRPLDQVQQIQVKEEEKSEAVITTNKESIAVPTRKE